MSLIIYRAIRRFNNQLNFTKQPSKTDFIVFSLLIRRFRFCFQLQTLIHCPIPIGIPCLQFERLRFQPWLFFWTSLPRLALYKRQEFKTQIYEQRLEPRRVVHKKKNQTTSLSYYIESGSLICDGKPIRENRITTIKWSTQYREIGIAWTPQVGRHIILF